jgi:hypothetical protein
VEDRERRGEGFESFSNERRKFQNGKFDGVFLCMDLAMID